MFLNNRHCSDLVLSVCTGTRYCLTLAHSLAALRCWTNTKNSPMHWRQPLTPDFLTVHLLHSLARSWASFKVVGGGNFLPLVPPGSAASLIFWMNSFPRRRISMMVGFMVTGSSRSLRNLVSMWLMTKSPHSQPPGWRNVEVRSGISQISGATFKFLRTCKAASLLPLVVVVCVWLFIKRKTETHK